jgi:hypothetical protein
MRPNRNDNIATHKEPVWAGRTNTIFYVETKYLEDVEKWEQLWGKKTGHSTLVLCCIPFFVYDLALGDEVELDSNGRFLGIVKDGGHRTYRVWFGGQTNETQERIVREITALGPFVERSSEHLIAISAPGRAMADQVVRYLDQRKKEGLLVFELGRTKEPDVEPEIRLEPPPDEPESPRSPTALLNGPVVSGSTATINNKILPEDFVAIHSSPAWADRVDFLFHVFLGVKEGRNGWEQMSGRRTSANSAIVCCIPFYARDIQLGDDVELDDDSVLKRVVHQSGQYAIKVWGKRITDQLLIEGISPVIPVIERYSENLVALSVPESAAEHVTDYLHSCVHARLLVYETGRSPTSDGGCEASFPIHPPA